MEPFEEKKTVSPLRRFLCELELNVMIDFIHSTKASWGVTRPEKPNDRRQSAPYRARIQVPGHVEHTASGNTAKGAIANALASFLSFEQGDYHSMMAAAQPPKEK